MNPRTAAKSAKSAKKKTAGSDFSSARGSEERQSLPPGRGQKRGRDNEIEKVRSSISSDSSLSRTSPRRITPSKKVLESTEVEEASVSPRKKRPRITLHLSNSPAQLSANNVREQQDGASNKQMPDATATKENLSRLLNDTSGSLVPAERKATEQDIDVNFWAEEAALLDVDFVFGPTKVALAYPKVQLGSTNILTANKPTSKKRARSEVYVPLDQASDSFIANRVSKMLRNKAKTIGDGLDPPWPSERPKGPQRHPKWIHTLHVDSHNHAKLAFYAEILPTDNPVIAGFPPENPPPDLILKPETFSPPNTKRKTKAAPYGHAFDPGDQPATKRMCRRSSSTTDNECQRRIIPGKRNLVEGQAPADDRDTKHIDRNRDNPPKNIQGANDIIQGFQSLKQQLSIQDSDDETNSELEQEEQFHARPAVKIEVPDHLKAILVDDWENVTKNLSLVPIPADHPVSEILSTYFEEEKGKRRLGSAEADLLEEVVQGTKDYFEQCLGKLLLYRFEREQYFRLHQAMEKGKDEFEGRPLKDKKIADIYGAEHLCRLFGKFCLALH